MAEYPNRTPKADDLRRLPRWAQVAFAARCASRALTVGPGLPRSNKQLVEEFAPACEFAELSARSAGRFEFPHVVTLVDTSVAVTEDPERFGLHNVRLAISHAAIAAREAARHASGYGKLVIPSVEAAADHARIAVADYASNLNPPSSGQSGTKESLTRAYGLASSAAGDAMRADYDLLLTMSLDDNWTDDTPVDPDLLGPLWPEGVPDWWPEEDIVPGASPSVMAIEFSIPQGLDQDEAAKNIGSIIEACNQMHHAFGGTGLRFHEPPISFESASCPIPAGGDDDRGSGDGWRDGGGGR